MESVTRYVEGKLKRKANREKSTVDRPWNRKFLGFRFLSNRQATIRLAPKTISRFKEEDKGADEPNPPDVDGEANYPTGWLS